MYIKTSNQLKGRGTVTVDKWKLATIPACCWLAAYVGGGPISE